MKSFANDSPARHKARAVLWVRLGDFFALVVRDWAVALMLLCVVSITLVAQELQTPPVVPIRVGRSPAGVAFSPSNRRVYVSNAANHTISMVDPQLGRVVRTFRAGRGPTGLAFTPNGLWLLVCNSQSREVSLLEGSAGREVRTFRVGNGPRFVAVTHDGRKAYVTCERSDRVYVLDLTVRRVLREVPLGTWLSGVAVSPDDRFVFAAGSVDQKIYVLDTWADRPIGQIPAEVGNNTNLAVSADGRFLYATGAKDLVLKIDLATAQVVKRAAVGANPAGLAITPDERYLGVTNMGSSNVSIIDLANFTELQTVPVGPQPTAVAAAPNGAFYVANSGAEAISVILFQPPEKEPTDKRQ